MPQNLPRKKIPATTANKIKAQFNHRCAICGKDNPQLHHIDGNHSNNSEENLLPLCPNHHLIDAHSPTAPIDKGKLILFRIHQDPTIFSAQFHALFERMKFLLEVENVEFRLAETAANELVKFVRYLKMGKYYSGKLKKLIVWNEPVRITSLSAPDSFYEQLEKEDGESYRKQLAEHHQAAIKLLMESLRFQSWHIKGKYNDI